MRKSRIPEDFVVTPRIRELAYERGWPNPDSEVEAFMDYHRAKGTLMLDWEAAFRTWLRNALKFGAHGKQGKAERLRDQTREAIERPLPGGKEGD